MTDAFRMLWRLMSRWLVLLLAVLIGVGIGLGVGLLQAKSYQASAYLLVVPSSNQADDQTAIRFAQAYARIATSRVVVGSGTTVPGARTPSQIADAVQVSSSPDTPLLELAATAGSADDAAELANTIATDLTSYANTRANLTGVRLADFSKAAAPTAPSSPNIPVDAAVGGALGLLLGGLMVLAWPARSRIDREFMESVAAEPHAVSYRASSR